MRVMLTIAAVFACGACTSIQLPIAAKTDDGRVLRGVVTAPGIGVGSFTLAGANLSCIGTYDAYDLNRTVKAAVSCSDGRTGTATVRRDFTSLNGTGSVVMTDGSSAELIYGDAAPKAFK